MLPSSLKFLVVEDLVSDSFLIQRQLNKLCDNAEIRFADSQLALTNALKKYMPDFIISDFSLSGFDGFDVIRMVKDHDPNLIILIISGSLNNDEKVAQLLMEGASGFFLKDPINELPEKLRPVLEKLYIEKQEQLEKLDHQRKKDAALDEVASFLREFDSSREDADEDTILQTMQKSILRLFPNYGSKQ
ncbi:response regulator [Aquimarina intermedia]|uniref:Response regulator receiver domain-containing protein n=1 Tax=Aquimarina intermedia TaxID=350814 RepID=A0A5S5BX98_9FLAO|nr:response regulator [Aquimarina intermedia]TYP71634.1 response regulator receiver domain-containing protein [Aquimarina intermedia]